MVNGSQCTIVFYADDNKISHKDPRLVTQVLNSISEHFWELIVSRGNTRDFLGMNITIKDQKVYIEMKDQIHKAIEWGKSQGGCKLPNPAKSDLFEVDEPSIPLSEKDSDVFYSVVQKLLYICKRTRPGIETAISFLCTRVSGPTHEDEVKLTRVLGYLEHTIDLVRTMGASSLSVLSTWVDASYAVHRDMRSHTGSLMSFGTGTIHCKSSK